MHGWLLPPSARTAMRKTDVRLPISDQLAAEEHIFMANAYFTHNSVMNDCRSWRFDDPLATAGELSKTKGTFQGARTLNLAVRRDLDHAMREGASPHATLERGVQTFE